MFICECGCAEDDHYNYGYARLCTICSCDGYVLDTRVAPTQQKEVIHMLARFFRLFDSVEELIHKSLSSRKFMASATATVAALHAHNLPLAVASALGYVAVEGFLDSKNIG